MKHLVVIAMLMTSALTQVAQASELLRSNPNSGAVLDEPLRAIHLWFDELPAASQASVRIIGPGESDESVQIRGLHRMGESDLMGMLVGSMPDGDYVLAWSVDGSEGSLPFVIQRPAGHVDDHWEPPLDIGIVLYDGAEPLDVFGPLEMWMNAGPENIRVHLIAEEKRPIALTTTSYPAALAPRLEAQYAFDDAPELDVLMVPGGIGSFEEVNNPRMLEFLRRAAGEVAVVTSVCTGSALYAKAGLLEGVEATGNKLFFDFAVAQGPAIWKPEARWVESGRFFTSSGVSAGIDMSLAVIARFFGTEAAHMIADGAEYVWNEDPDNDPFIDSLNRAMPYIERPGAAEPATRGEHGRH